MALVDFLYRCPFCGHDPMQGRGDLAQCPSCSRRYEPVGVGTRIRVTEEGGEPTLELPARALSARLHELGGPLTRALDSKDRLFHSSEAQGRFSVGETAVRFQGRLMGYFERLSSPVRGELVLDGSTLEFGGREWPLLDLRSLQAVSSALQITSRDGSLAHFRFIHDSPRRWEELLRAAVQETWSAAGRGQVVEFQPRIRGE
jgi:hypothetical protein